MAHYFPSYKLLRNCSETEQKNFLNHQKSLITVTEERPAINPFKENSVELITLDTGEMMDPAIVDSFREVPNKGKQFNIDFVRDRAGSATKLLPNVI